MNYPSSWVDGLTFEQVLQRTVQRFPENDALVFPQLRYRRTYAQFHDDVRAAARALLCLGIRRGEHLGVWATNWPQWVVIQFAAAQVGAVLVNINPAYRAHELEYVLNQAEITTLFLTDRFKSTDYFDILENVCPEVSERSPLKSSRCPRLRHVVSIKDEGRNGIVPWQRFLQGGESRSEEEVNRRAGEIEPSDVVNIQYTSGTTGFPKGAMLTHRNLLMNAFHVGERLEFTDRDRLAIPVPFYHCFGCVMGTLMCAVYGSAMVVPAEAFDALATLQAIPSAAPASMACRPCLSLNCTILALESFRWTACAPASWPAVPAPSRSCARSSNAWACAA